MKIFSAIVVVLAIAVAGCAGSVNTLSKTEAQAELVAAQGLDLAVTTYGQLKRTMSPRCAAGALDVSVCRGMRLFGEGSEPKNDVCAAGTLDRLSAVQEKCGFEVSSKLLVKAFREGSNISASVFSQLADMIKVLNGFASRVGVS